MSPISIASNVVTPILLMLGEGDRRVPPSQGLHWYRYLQGKGLNKIKVMMFPDTGHALDSVIAEKYGLEALVTMFYNNLST